MSFPTDWLVGVTLSDRYVITRYIAPGGFCYVYEADDQALNMPVAIKLMLPGANSEDIADFDQEGDILRILEGASHVVDLVETDAATLEMSMQGLDRSFPMQIRFHVLELADCCLTELLVDLPTLRWEDRIHLYRGVVKGVHQADLLNVVHRDHKSENVLVFARGGSSADSKIADFGRARSLEAGGRFSPADYASGRGDLRFAPPEMVWCLADGSSESWRRAELYLLGSVLFELATGVGITTQALGDPRSINHAALSARPELRQSGFDLQLPQIRAQYEAAYSVFEDEVPRPIRYEALRLLRTLTDPDPSKRRPGVFGLRRRDDGLSWVIRRTDILALILSRATAEATRLGMLKQRRSRSNDRKPN